MAQTLADGIPAAALTVLKEASHLSAVEQPEAFAAAVTDFIDRL
jgi:3-oxoadipate enol-lactonase